MRHQPRFAGLAALALCAACASARPAPARTTPIIEANPAFAPPETFGPKARELARRALNAEWSPAFAIGLVWNGKVEFHQFAASGARPTPDTVFEIGSLTKLFTAILLAQEVAAGRRTLHDTLAEFAGGLSVPSKDGRPIELWHYGTHRTGLPRLPPDWAPADPLNPYADYDDARIRRSVAIVEAPWAPGERYKYSNYAYGLLGNALVSAAGEPGYDELVRKRLLALLDMNDTAFELSEDMRARVIQGHDKQGKAVPNWDIPGLAGAGALRSTTRDMVKFLLANIYPPRNWLGDAIRLSHARRAGRGRSGDIGLGWRVGFRRYPTLSEVRWHNGETGGYHTFLAFDRTREVGVIVLANKRFNIDGLGIALLLALRGDVEVEPPAAPAPRS